MCGCRRRGKIINPELEYLLQSLVVAGSAAAQVCPASINVLVRVFVDAVHMDLLRKLVKDADLENQAEVLPLEKVVLKQV